MEPVVVDDGLQGVYRRCVDFVCLRMDGVSGRQGHENAIYIYMESFHAAKIILFLDCTCVFVALLSFFSFVMPTLQNILTFCAVLLDFIS